jgi:subtilisin family serine protease
MRVSMNPITNQYEVTLNVNAGPGTVWFENTAGKPSEAHLYFLDRDYGTFTGSSVVKSNLVGTPGAMENAITVGSYDWNDNFHQGGRVINLSSVCRDAAGVQMPLEIGWLSCYSSPGPLRNGTVKPEIVAPGEWFPSADAKNNGRSAGNWASPDSTGFYRAMNGTSAATPYTSGIVALMFQKNPALTLGEVKNQLKASATKTGLNPFSQAIPNNNWGYGKLDAAAIGRIFAAK